MTDPAVGFIAICVLTYAVLLMGTHSFIAHPSVSKRVMVLSYANLILVCLATGAIAMTYFVPHIDGSCICNGLWTTALLCYIVSLYALKFVYVERINILNKHPMFASPKLAKWIKIITYSLIASCIICIVAVSASTGGECHTDLTKYGCTPEFHVANVYLAMAMIIVDTILFGIFCYKWWGLIKVFRLSHDSQVLVDMVRSFSVQFVLTCIAMLSCVIDGIVNLSLHNYSALIMFCIDCAIVATCNFAMIKESQALMWKYVCFPCKLPILLIPGTDDVDGVDSNSSKTAKQPDVSTTSQTNASNASNTNTGQTITAAPSNTMTAVVIPTNSPQIPDKHVVTESNVYTPADNDIVYAADTPADHNI